MESKKLTIIAYVIQIVLAFTLAFFSITVAFGFLIVCCVFNLLCEIWYIDKE